MQKNYVPRIQWVPASQNPTKIFLLKWLDARAGAKAKGMVGVEARGMVGMVHLGKVTTFSPSSSRTFPMGTVKRTWSRFFRNGQGWRRYSYLVGLISGGGGLASWDFWKWKMWQVWKVNWIKFILETGSFTWISRSTGGSRMSQLGRNGESKGRGTGRVKRK